MIAVAVAPAIGPITESGLVILDGTRREYLGLSRDGTYWHHVRVARLEDPVVADGTVPVGALTCDCAAGKFGRACYWTKAAQALEADPPAGWDPA